MEAESISSQLDYEMEKHGLPEEEKKKLMKKLMAKYALLLLESARKASERSRDLVFPEITLDDLKEASEVVGLMSIEPSRIQKAQDEAKQWLIAQGLNGIWGWWSPLDPQELKPSIKKIWSTAISIKSLLRAGVNPRTSQIVKGIEWLLENRISNQNPSWARLPRFYQGMPLGEEHFNPNTYETSCVLLALQEARDVESCDKGILQDGIKNLLNHQDKIGYWSISLTPESRLNGYPNVGATAMALIAISRAKANGFRIRGIDDAISRAAQWLRDVQRPCGAWGEVDDPLGSTSKTSDALRALVESSPRKSKENIAIGTCWLLKNQGVVEDGRGWGWRKIADSKLVAGTVENTSCALNALLRAGKPADAASIQAGLRWLLNHQVEGNWRSNTPRVIIAFSEYVRRTRRSP